MKLSHANSYRYLLFSFNLVYLYRMAIPNSVYYFAYGSNMSSDVFRFGFRRFNPSSAESAVLQGYRLSFTEPGIPFFEPAFANVEEDESAYCEGVLYTITEKELDELDISEGNRAYNIIEVSLRGSKLGKPT